MYSRTHRSLAAIGCCLAGIGGVWLTGCSAGNSTIVQPVAQKSTGKVRLTIKWPAQSKSIAATRYIPGYAASLFFELYPKGNPSQIYSVTANRPSDLPSTQQVTFSDLLPTGTYELAGAARALPDAQGATVASGALEIQVTSGMNPVALTLNSTVKSLLVLGQPISVGIGQNLTLQSGAFDPDGTGLLLPDGALVWSVVSGGQFGSITPAGVFTGKAAGAVTVQVQEPVTKVLATATVTVSTQTTNIGLANSGYPVAGATLSGTNLVTGSGATGTLAWTFTMDSRGYITPVLGNNMLFAISSLGVIYALDATSGAKIWQHQALAQAGFTASLVATDDNTIIIGTFGGVEAYDMSTGLQKWTNTDFSVSGGLLVNVGKLYTPSTNQGMGVIDARTGITITTYPAFNGGLNTYCYSPVIYNGVIYYLSQGVSGSGAGQGLFAVNLTSGATVWTKAVASATTTGVNVTTSGVVYLTLNGTTLQGLDAGTGAPVQSLAGFYPESQTAAIGQDGSVYFLRQDPVSHMIDTVKFDSTLTTEAWVSTQPFRQCTVGTDGVVYGGAYDPTLSNLNQTSLFALNPADGTVKWKVPLTAGVTASTGGFGGIVFSYVAVASNGWVYATAIDNVIYAIK